VQTFILIKLHGFRKLYYNNSNFVVLVFSDTPFTELLYVEPMPMLSFHFFLCMFIRQQDCAKNKNFTHSVEMWYIGHGRTEQILVVIQINLH